MDDEVYFWHAEKQQNFVSFWVCAGRDGQSTQNWKFAYLCNISRKTWAMNINVFSRVIQSLLIGMIKHSQRTQSNKISIALQYLENEVSHKAFS